MPSSFIERFTIPEFHTFVIRWHRAADSSDHATQSMAFAAMLSHARSILAYTDSEWATRTHLAQNTATLDYVGSALADYQRAESVFEKAANRSIGEIFRDRLNEYYDC